jgi:hypothetical protein
MKRNVILGICVLALAAAAPAKAAQPFGFFDSKADGGNAGAGLIGVVGWALDDDGIAAVDIYVDGEPAGRAHYGQGRPSVRKKFPGYPNSKAPGFGYFIDSTRYLNGRHKVEALVRTKSGETRFLNPVNIEFLNNPHNLPPFGKIEFPAHQAELRGNCNVADAARRYSVISGYAMDVGLTEEDEGVGYVELLIDRALWANTQTDCRYSAIEGGMSDCYGLPRLDLETVYPHVKDAPHSGFRFVLDVGALMTFLGYTPGSHVLTVRAGDHADQVTNIAELKVNFICDESLGNELSFGDVHTPHPGGIYSGVIQVLGWALDIEGIHQVFVFIDGAYVAEAAIGLPRPDVNSFYPGYPDSAISGWLANLDTTVLSDGPHDLEVLVRDDTGFDTYIGKRVIIVHNP